MSPAAANTTLPADTAPKVLATKPLAPSPSTNTSAPNVTATLPAVPSRDVERSIAACAPTPLTARGPPTNKSIAPALDAASLTNFTPVLASPTETTSPVMLAPTAPALPAEETLDRSTPTLFTPSLRMSPAAANITLPADTAPEVLATKPLASDPDVATSPATFKLMLPALPLPLVVMSCSPWLPAPCVVTLPSISALTWPDTISPTDRRRRPVAEAAFTITEPPTTAETSPAVPDVLVLSWSIAILLFPVAFTSDTPETTTSPDRSIAALSS